MRPMIRKLWRELGAVKTALLITGISIISSVVLYTAISLLFGEVLTRGLVIAIVIPAIVTPLLSYTFLLIVLKLDVAEEALAESDKLLRATLESTADGILVVDERGEVTHANSQFAQMWHIPDELLRSRDDEKLLNYVLDQLEEPRAFLSKVQDLYKKTETSLDTLFFKDGRVFERYSAPLIRDSEIAGRVWSFRDVTSRKEAEETLRESEEKYRGIFENVSDFLYFHDLEGNFAETNLAFKTEWGYNENDLANMNVRDLVPERYRDQFRDYLERIISNGKENGLMRIMTKDGHERIVEYRNSVIQDPTGPIGVRGSARDVTEQIQATKALQESEEKFRLLVEHSPLGVLLIGEGGHFKYINPKFTEMFGYTLEEISTGREWFRKAYPDREYRKQVISIWTTDHKGSKVGEAGPRTFSVRCKDGLEKVIHFRSVSMKRGEQLVLCEDITEKLQLETQLRQAQKMEALGTLAGGIAHDFNNLLMAIQGNASLMLLKKDPGDRDYARLKNIEQYIQNGAELTKQLLGFARGGKYEVRTTDLNELLKKSSEMFGRTRKEVTIHPKYQEGVWAVEVDQGQIEQVLMNLYINAWQAMPGGGKLFLETENIELDQNLVRPYGVKPGRYVKISMSDTGVGMDKETRERIFDPFFTTKEMGRGTGLGLASVYGIIKNHGGIIDVSSRKGEGSTFKIYLPASEKEVPREKELPEELLEGTETILLVDDEGMIIDSGREMLQEMGYTLLTAESGMEAIDIYRERTDKIDLVILDMIMPDMGGGETFDRLRELDPEIKVLLSSGYSLDDQAREILRRGCSGFIQKPFNLKEISYKIREILGKKSS